MPSPSTCCRDSFKRQEWTLKGLLSFIPKVSPKLGMTHLPIDGCSPKIDEVKESQGNAFWTLYAWDAL